MRILVVNVGSTSIKLRVIGERDRVEGSEALPPLADLGAGVLDRTVGRLGPIDAIGHRVVHGGTRFTAPVMVTDDVIAQLSELVDMAPIHQPPALAAMRAVAEVTAGIPMVACFDTAFHATMPPEASTYAIPQEWRDFGARRYGFHGLSHAWASRRAVELSGLPATARIVTCHLGGGASLAAVTAGRSVETTMGFTPLDGLVMSGRSGSLDPGLVVWLHKDERIPVSEIGNALDRRSGLLGLCGTGDMREVTARAAAGDPAATLAFGVYIHRLRAGIATMTAALGGLDALVFTGGVGEGSVPVRAEACAGLGFLGVALDAAANAAARLPDARISAAASAVQVFVVEAREDLEIAHGVRAALTRSS